MCVCVCVCVCVRAHTGSMRTHILLYMCAIILVSSYCFIATPPQYCCVCVLILQYMSHATIYADRSGRRGGDVLHCTICVRILLKMCPHTTICVRMLLYMLADQEDAVEALRAVCGTLELVHLFANTIEERTIIATLN